MSAGCLVWLVPPWQHYDEPTHFEYAALIRELGRLPLIEEQIPALRRAIATSMIESGFYSNRAAPLTPPDLNSPTLSIGINERGHPPLYYLRNAGAEEQIPPLLNTPRFLTGGLLDQGTLGKLFDRAWISAVYPRQVLLLFQGFWGLFGWGERSVSPGWFTPLGLLVLASLLGVAWRTLREYWPRRAGHLNAEPQQRAMPANIWWLCLLAVALGWGAALLRVHSQTFPGVMIWSFGRYIFVAILPSLLVFSAGLGALMPMRLRAQGLVGIVGFLMIYAISALLALLHA